MTQQGIGTRRGSRAKAVVIFVALALMTISGLPTAATPAAAVCVPRAAFVADVTVPDNSTQIPGAAMLKVWRLRNMGSCDWGPGTEVDALAFAGGDQLGAPDREPLTAIIAPGRTGDVAVTLTAPMTAGTYTSRWKLRRTDFVLSLSIY